MSAFVIGTDDMTADQKRRVVEALAETHRLIAKEERYAVDLQKPEYLAGLYRHVAKLVAMMEAV